MGIKQVEKCEILGIRLSQVSSQALAVSFRQMGTFATEQPGKAKPDPIKSTTCQAGQIHLPLDHQPGALGNLHPAQQELHALFR